MENSTIASTLFSFYQPTGTYQKTQLSENCWMKLYMSGCHGAAMIAFVNSEDKNVNVPDGFVLKRFSCKGDSSRKIDPMSPQFFALKLDYTYSFSYGEKSGKFIAQWAIQGDFVFE